MLLAGHASEHLDKVEDRRWAMKDQGDQEVGREQRNRDSTQRLPGEAPQLGGLVEVSGNVLQPRQQEQGNNRGRLPMSAQTVATQVIDGLAKKESV